MAQKDVKVKIKVTDDGTLKKTKRETDKAAKSTDKLDKSSKKLNRTRNNYHKQEKGTAGLTSNSTKAFSKQAQTIGGGSSGLVGAYATLAANVFALTAVFGVLSRNKGFQQLQEGIVFTGRAAGTHLPMVASGLKEITDNAISTADAMKAVAIGTSAGFDSGQLEGLTRVAKGASLALGRNMTDAMDRLVRGAAKLEPEILDELGIMVRLDETTEKYAATLGKTAGDLTTFEKRMAFTNAIIEQGEKKFGQLNNVIEASPYSKLASTFDSLLKAVLGFAEKGLSPIISLIASSTMTLAGTIAIFASGVIKMMVPALSEGAQRTAEMAVQTRNLAKEQLANVRTFANAPKVYTQLQKKMAAGTATSKDMEAAKLSLNRSIAIHQRHLDADPAKYAKSTAAGQAKRETIRQEKLALQELTHVQMLETKATQLSARADVMNTASSGGLIATIKALSATFAQETAALQAETAATNAAAAAKQRLALAAGQAAFGIKAIGTAIMTAIPIIGMILFALSMLIAGFKKFFVKPPTALEEQLKKTKEAMDEMPSIISQMVDTYSAATDAADRFSISLNTQVGMVNTITAQLRKQVLVQNEAILKSKAEARANLIKAKIQLEADRKSGKAFKSRGKAGTIDKSNKRAVAQAQAEFDALEGSVIDVEKTKSAFLDTLSMGITNMELLNEGVNENSDEFRRNQETLKGLNTAMEQLKTVQTVEDIQEFSETMERLKVEVGSAKDAFDSATESQAKLNEHFTKMKAPQGQFAMFEQELSNIADKLGAAGTSLETFLQYEDTLKRFTPDALKTLKRLKDDLEKAGGGDLTITYTAETKEINKETGALETVTREYTKVLDTQASLQAQLKSALDITTIALENQAEKFAKASRLAREYNSVNKQADQKFSEAQLGGLTTTAFKDKKTNIDTRVTRAEDILEATKLTEDPVAIQAAEDRVAQAKRDVRDFKRDQIDMETGLVTRRGGALSGDAESARASIRKAGIEEGGGAFDPTKTNVTTTEKLSAMNDAFKPMVETLASLGPEGEAMALATQGFMNLSETISNAFEGGIASGADLAKTIGASIGAVNSIMQGMSKQRVAGIDREIAAEKKLDGKSKESVEKIKKLEKKKDEIKRKAFEQDKKMKMAQVVMATAAAAMEAAKGPPGMPWSAAFVGMAIALGAMQLSAIASTSYEGGGSVADAGKSDVSVGERSNTVDLAKSKSAVGELGYSRGGMGTGGMGDFKPAFTGARYRAVGGSTGFVVGEQGPELFMPDTPGTIVPADDTPTAGGGTTNLNFTINAIDSQDVERTLSGQTGNIIRMIRETANDAGETFLEGLDERY